MVLFPNCKINLGLHIVGKRPDGYHNLETVFLPVPLTDCLEIIPNKQFTFQSTGLPIAGTEEQNLCVKAYKLLKEQFPNLPNVTIHLHKVIPMGAGLGGGSANGAYTLLLLKQLFQLPITQQQLLEMALQLGSDCPFFILNQPCLATGRGELMEPISLDLNNYHIVLVNPGIHINTAWAFQQITPAPPLTSLADIVAQPITEWHKHLTNDFEAPAVSAHPSIGTIKTQLYQQGAVYAAMTGTGSTVFGIFPNTSQPAFSFPESYFVYRQPVQPL